MKAHQPDFEALRATAIEWRADIIRMIAAAGSGHPGGSLSAIDIITYLYCHRMRIDPANPHWEDRDRFVLSKGHCAPALYVALAGRGYFPREMLWTLRDIESKLQGHPDMTKTPGCDMTTGSLGQGFACAAGIALGGKLLRKDFRVYVVLSDGELQEGIIWEAAMAAAHNRLDNLVVFIDNNKLQTDGRTAEIMNPNPIADKWRAFGWSVQEIDGHDFGEIHHAAERCQARMGAPHLVVADTVKGKGIPSMENEAGWHSLGKPLTDR
ncbi:MAG: transketolase, partial [bacterium]|nr:transketolase [bacterium]